MIKSNVQHVLLFSRCTEPQGAMGNVALIARADLEFENREGRRCIGHILYACLSVCTLMGHFYNPPTPDTLNLIWWENLWLSAS